VLSPYKISTFLQSNVFWRAQLITITYKLADFQFQVVPVRLLLF